MTYIPEVYDQAVELAYLANDAYDSAASSVNKLKNLGAIDKTPGIDLLNEAVVAAVGEYLEAEKKYHLCSQAVGALVGPTALDIDLMNNPGLANQIEIFLSMSIEQKILTAKLRTEIAKNFEQYGVKESDLHVIEVNSQNGESEFVLVHIGTGIDIGDPEKENDPARSYDAVMSAENDKLFIVEVDGRQYDTRKGMTEEVYEARFKHLQDKNLPIPDTLEFSQKTGDIWTVTLLTGEPKLAGGKVKFNDVDGELVNSLYAGANHAHPEVRVCPAVPIVVYSKAKSPTS